MRSIYSKIIQFSWLCALLFMSCVSAYAQDKIYTELFSDKAVSGYDTVAYFNQGKAVKGNDEFKTDYAGVVWLFSSNENLEAFKSSPEKYMPQYGGHCAYAVAAKNALVSADPETWKIVNGKLYLNYDKDVQKIWEKDIPGYIKKADINWPDLAK